MSQPPPMGREGANCLTSPAPIRVGGWGRPGDVSALGDALDRKEPARIIPCRGEFCFLFSFPHHPLPYSYNG